MDEPSPEVKVRLFARIARAQRAAALRRFAVTAATTVVVTLGSVVLRGGGGGPLPPPTLTPLTVVQETRYQVFGIDTDERLVPVEGRSVGALRIGSGSS